MELNKIYNEDCLMGMKKIPDKSVNLVVIDPPYNIKKAKWDTWKTVADYVDFMGKVFQEIQRVLKDNGSFYFFHNDFLQMVELQNYINNNTDFIFKQLIVWNKKFEDYHNQLHAIVHSDKNRNYPKLSEYCLFYTFEDETGLSKVLKQDGFYNLMSYFKEERNKLGWNYTQCDKFLGIKASYCYWDKPTTHPYRIPEEKHYKKLQETGFYKREYEDLRQEYEDLRYTFNNQKTHHSVWNYEISKSNGHITPKPIPLIENIIKHSSNKNDIILDCFMGSGTTAIAAINTNRNYIGFELDETYYKLATDRIKNHKNQLSLELG